MWPSSNKGKTVISFCILAAAAEWIFAFSHPIPKPAEKRAATEKGRSRHGQRASGPSLRPSHRRRRSIPRRFRRRLPLRLRWSAIRYPIFCWGFFLLRSCSLLPTDRWFLLPPLNLCLLGVIWKGDKLIEGVGETMELLRKMVHGIWEHSFITIFCQRVMARYWVRLLFFVWLSWYSKSKIESYSCFLLISKVTPSFYWNKCEL